MFSSPATRRKRALLEDTAAARSVSPTALATSSWGSPSRVSPLRPRPPPEEPELGACPYSPASSVSSSGTPTPASPPPDDYDDIPPTLSIPRWKQVDRSHADDLGDEEDDEDDPALAVRLTTRTEGDLHLPSPPPGALCDCTSLITDSYQAVLTPWMCVFDLDDNECNGGCDDNNSISDEGGNSPSTWVKPQSFPWQEACSQGMVPGFTGWFGSSWDEPPSAEAQWSGHLPLASQEGALLGRRRHRNSHLHPHNRGSTSPPRVERMQLGDKSAFFHSYATDNSVEMIYYNWVCSGTSSVLVVLVLFCAQSFLPFRS